jgi:hypothetical protein
MPLGNLRLRRRRFSVAVRTGVEGAGGFEPSDLFHIGDAVAPGSFGALFRGIASELAPHSFSHPAALAQLSRSWSSHTGEPLPGH